MGEFDYEDRLTITTPEGVELALTLAGVASRFIAAIIDALIEGVILLAVGVLLLASDGLGGGRDVALAVFVVTFFSVFWGYDVAFEVLASGRTPGKRWNGLRVVQRGGQPIGFLASAIRNVLRLVDWLPSFYLVGIVSILVTGANQRLGDLVAGTVVIREPPGARRGGSAFLTTPPAPPPPPRAWDVSAIGAEEVAAVRQFLERRSAIDAAARYELAVTLAARLRPKVAGAADDIAPEQFLEQLVAAKLRR